MAVATKTIPSPVGRLTLAASDVGLVAILWHDDRLDRVRLGPRTETTDHPVLRQTEAQLADYFAGRRTVFDITLDMAGTVFQKRVWAALRDIPYGETRSYRDLAVAIGHPKATRAVGAANGRNPVSIIVPCHRAIGSNGSLTGFAGGLDVKRHLLALESGQAIMAGCAAPIGADRP